MKRLLTLASMLVLSAGIALAQSNSSSGQNSNAQPSGIAAAQSGGAPSQDSGAVGTGQMQGKDANQADQSSATPTSTQSTTSSDTSKTDSHRRTADQPSGIKAAESGGAPTQDQGAVGYDQKSSDGSYKGQKVNTDNSNNPPPTNNSTGTDNSTAPPPSDTPNSTNPR